MTTTLTEWRVTEIELTAESYTALTYERPILPPHWGWRTNNGAPNPQYMRPASDYYCG